MIQLCNELDKDLWICVPHLADSTYVANMAQLFLDSLDDHLNIYLEYSNEVWNWIFPQAHYNNDNRPGNLNYGRAMAEKAGKTFAIWHNVFGDQACRVKRVLGIQAGFNYLNEQILSQLPQDAWDYGSPTHYFGLDHGSTGNPRLDLLGSSATVQDILNNAINGWNAFRPSVKLDYRNIQVFGKKSSPTRVVNILLATRLASPTPTNKPCGMLKMPLACTTSTIVCTIPFGAGVAFWLPTLAWPLSRKVFMVPGVYSAISRYSPPMQLQQKNTRQCLTMLQILIANIKSPGMALPIAFGAIPATGIKRDNHKLRIT
ncbi:MAG: hypothetical protein IPH36_16110 [Saprospiraceae bacterium]|nr:hypothetical protein [Saprospiraceae bacterium]